MTAIPKILRNSVILFPGQGTQFVGMANDLCAKGKALFDIANEVLGYDLLRLCQQGPEDELNKTIHSQPAVFVTSLAAAEKLASLSREAVENCSATAGFSVGEFSALVFAQSMDFVDALRLIKLRAEATQVISQSVPTAMATILYANNARLSQACHLASEYCIRSGIAAEESVCSVANHLFPHGKVVGGHQKAIEFLETNAKEFGLKRIKRLAVSGAFHTSIMRSAEIELKTALSKMKIKDPKIRVYSNLDAKTYNDAEQVRKALPRHVHQPVMWEQIMQKLYGDLKSPEGLLPVTFECGPQNSLTTILGMVNLRAKKLAYNIPSIDNKDHSE